MKRSFTFLLALLFCSLLGRETNAQNRIDTPTGLEENFNSWPLEGWTIHKTMEGSSWVAGGENAYEGSGFVKKIDEMCDSDDWLVSPKFIVPANGCLEFFEENEYVHLPTFEKHEVFITTGGTDPYHPDYKLLRNMSDVHTDWFKQQINLIAYAGQEVQIAFHYVGNFASVWKIDALRVFEKQQFDAAVLDIVMPNFVQADEKVTPAVKMANYGSLKMSNVLVKMNVNGVMEQKTITIEPEQEVELAFSEITVTEETQIEVEAIFAGELPLENNTRSEKIHILQEEKAFAYCIYSKDGEIPMGPVHFQSTTPATINSFENACEDYVFPFGGCMIDNLWFASIIKYTSKAKDEAKSASKGVTPHNFVLMDTETGKLLNIAPSDQGFTEMSYNPIDDKVYALNKFEDGQKLFRIDYTKGEVEYIATAAGINTEIMAFAINKDGKAYGIGLDAALYEIKLADFTFNRIGKTGVSAVKSIQSMAFDMDNDILYWNQCSNTTAGFYAVDLETGYATPLGDLQAQAELTSFGFKTEEEKRYTIFHITDELDRDLKGIDVVINGCTLTSDATGIATFLGLEEDANLNYVVGYAGEELDNGTFVNDVTKEIKVTLSDLDIKDIEVLSIDMKAFEFVGDEVTPTVKIKNSGFADLSDLSIKIKMGSYEAEKVVSLNVNSTMDVTFDAFTLPEENELTASVQLIGDATPENNTISKSITALYPKTAYGYSIYTKDGQLGPVRYAMNAPEVVSNLDRVSVDNIYAKSGCMINNLWFVNNVLKTDKGREDKATLSPENYALINTTTGQQLNIAPADKMFMEMAYNYKDEKVYGVIEEGETQHIYTIDYKTGDVTKVSSSDAGLTTLMTFAIDTDGVGYAIGFDRYLYRIDLSTFNYEIIGFTDVESVQYSQSMAFDHENDLLYWNLSNNTDGELYYVNTTSGKANLIGTLQGDAEITAMGFPYGENRYYAAIETLDDEAKPMKNVSVNMNDQEVLTDKYGIALFMNLNKDQNYTYTATASDAEVTSDIVIDDSKVVTVNMYDVGIEETHLNALSVAPNPSKGSFKIEGLVDEDVVEVYDAQGSLILNHVVSGSSCNIDLRGNAAGVYYMQVKSALKVRSEKLILR